MLLITVLKFWRHSVLASVPFEARPTMIDHRAALLVTCFCFSATLAAAGELEDQITRATHDAEAADEVHDAVGGKEGNLVAVPLPIVDPTIGNGLALTGLYTFATSEQADTPRSTVGVAAGYTDTESWLAGAGFKIHLAGDRYRLGATVGYGRLNLEFFGVGSDSFFADHPVDFAVEGGFGEVTAQVRVLDGAYLGLRARFLSAEIAVETPIDVLPTLTANFVLTGFGPIIEYDTRDNSWWPTGGSRATATFLFYDEAIVSDVGFSTFDGRFAHYWSLADDLVLAGEVRGAVTSDDAPFFMNPFVSVRGFPAGQLLDSVVAQAQAELRWTAWNRIGVVAFAGLGATAPDLRSLDDGPLAVGVGGGLRYRVSKIDRMNAGLDVAYGDGDMAVYFRIGEAF
jgi:outer membrane protein assembly factor BamA